MKTEEKKPEFQLVGFFVADIPAGMSTANPCAGALLLATEKFGFKSEDYNPGHGGRFYGHSKYGYTFEVQVRWAPAEALAARNHPDILNIFP